MRSRYERGPGRDRSEPFAQFRMPAAPEKTRIARFHAKAAAQRNVNHVESAAHQRMIDFALPHIHHPPGAIRFVLNDARRSLVLGPRQLAAPDGKAIHHAPRQRFEASPIPELITAGQIERRLAVEMIQVCANNRRFLQPRAVLTHQIRNPTGWVDFVVRTIGDARLGRNYLHPLFQALLQNDDSRHARVWGSGRDVELHHAREDPPSQPGMEAARLIQVSSCFSSVLSDSRTSSDRASLAWPTGGTGLSDVPLKKVNLTWRWKAANARNQPRPST